MNRTVAAVIALSLVSGCSKPAQNETNVAPAAPQPTQTPAPENPATPAPAPPKPRPTIDPKSTEAAELLVAGFVKLVNQGRLGDAYMLLGPNAEPRKQFESDFGRYSGLKVNAGAAGDQEGAAGSIYLSVPLEISGRVNGDAVHRSATAIVRRVNDVPGSTEAQREWHIERIDWEKS